MKKIILLLVIFLCAFKSSSQTAIELPTFKNTVSVKKGQAIRPEKGDVPKTLNISLNDDNSKKISKPLKAQIVDEVLFDSDGDGILDNIDIDDDNDGIRDVDEENLCRNSPIATLLILCDTDNDGVPDVFDLDSDNDGIPDIVEAGLGNLSNGTGHIAVTWLDANNNGLHDAAELIILTVNDIPDSDGDGVPNFNTDQEFPLGIKIAKAGSVTIKIDELENMDENISVHIKDKLTSEIHNISNKSFEINLESGAYLDRFALTFRLQKLVDEDVVAEVLIPAETQPIIKGIHVFMDNEIGELQIKNNSDDEIISITLFNYLGQTIKTWNSNFNIRIISLPINIASGTYFAQISTKNKKIIKKIVIN